MKCRVLLQRMSIATVCSRSRGRAIRSVLCGVRAETELRAGCVVGERRAICGEFVCTDGSCNWGEPERAPHLASCPLPAIRLWCLMLDCRSRRGNAVCHLPEIFHLNMRTGTISSRHVSCRPRGTGLRCEELGAKTGLAM